LDDAYCNVLLLAHWPVRQKLNGFSSVQLRRSIRAFTGLPFVGRLRNVEDREGGRLRILDDADQQDDAVRGDDSHGDDRKHRAQDVLPPVPEPQGRSDLACGHREDYGRRRNLDRSCDAGNACKYRVVLQKQSFKLLSVSLLPNIDRFSEIFQ